MSFDARDPGNPIDAWERVGVRDRAVPLDLGPVRRLVVLAAHPDDETLMASGIMRDVAARGDEVVVVLATRGEASHPDSPTVSAAMLAQLREAEVAAAVALLAPAAGIHSLGLPDGALADRRVELAEGIRPVVRPGDVLVAPWRHDGHPDHEVLGAVAAEIAAETGALLLEAPIWAWHWGDPDLPDWPPAVRHDLSAVTHDLKLRAIQHHGTQVAPLSDLPGDEVLLGPHLLAHFRGSSELFFPSGHRAVDFDAMYEQSDDPWGFVDRWYERRKRAITLGSLPHERYARALEIGCSNGLLAEALASRCDELLAVDAAPRAVQLATERLARFPQAHVARAALPGEWPEGTFDAIVLSETGFYFSTEALLELVARARASLRPGGVLLACHWRPHVAGLELSGDRVHDLIREHLGATVLVRHVEDDFVLEVLQTDPAAGVATATGLR